MVVVAARRMRRVNMQRHDTGVCIAEGVIVIDPCASPPEIHSPGPEADMAELGTTRDRHRSALTIQGAHSTLIVTSRSTGPRTWLVLKIVSRKVRRGSLAISKPGHSCKTPRCPPLTASLRHPVLPDPDQLQRAEMLRLR